MKRPRQHIVETTSRKAFEKLLPNEWVARQLSDDYGIDYMVELFEHNESTGDFFYVQLKGTDQDVHNNEVKISLQVSSLEYYQSLPLPILFIVYSTRKDKFWGIWINEYLRTRKIKENQKTLQLTFNDSHFIDEKFIADVRAKVFSDPIRRIAVTHHSDHTIGEKYHNALGKWIQHFYQDLVILDYEHFPIKLCFKYSYKDGYLSIEIDYSLLGSYKMQRISLDEESDFLNYPINDYSEVPVEIKEILFFLATIFAGEDTLTSLGLYKMLLYDYSGNFKSPESLLNIGKNSIEKGYIAGFQELIEKSIEHEQYYDTQAMNMAYLLYSSNSADLVADYYKENLLRMISSVEDKGFRGMLSYNLANSYRSSGDKEKAVKYYMQAKRLESDYLNRDYWWYELAGVLFLKKHYKWAESCYLRAHELSSNFEPLIFALIGDSLFFQGRFAEAVEWLDRSFECNHKRTEFCLKHLAAKFLISNKLENPHRDPQLAISLAGEATTEESDKDVTDRLMKAISIDPLCGLAWFNHAVYMNEKKRYKDSLISFLVCSLIQDGDREAWVNALFLSFTLEEDMLFAHILDTIKHKFGYSILKDMSEVIKKQKHPEIEKKRKLFAIFTDMFKSDIFK